MKQLEIQPNIFIVLDDGDYSVVAEKSWYIARGTNNHVITKYYWRIGGKLKQKHMRLTQFLIPHDPKVYYIKHMNGDQFDFQRKNLEALPIGLFNASRPLLRTNTSGFKGVTWDKRRQLWKAQITHKKQDYSLGYFHDIKDAALAYNNKALEFYGNYAWLNDVDSWEGRMNIAAHPVGYGEKAKRLKMRKVKNKNDNETYKLLE